MRITKKILVRQIEGMSAYLRLKISQVSARDSFYLLNQPGFIPVASYPYGCAENELGILKDTRYFIGKVPTWKRKGV